MTQEHENSIYNPRYEGTQKGIDVFGDMTFKQINFIAKKLRDIPVIRGCYNVCSHCLLYAKPPVAENGPYINTMAHEDFVALCEGFDELNSRLGFNIFHDPGKKQNQLYKTIFYDSDCSYVCTKDKQGNIHDFIELAGMLHKTTGHRLIFDTASWSPKDETAQKRMEKYAQFYSKDDNIRNLFKFNLSVNPFHSIYTASINAKKQGDLEKSEKYKNIYIDRMVNTIFTITPVIKKGNFDYIARAMKDGTKGGEGFTIKDCFLLYIDIFKKLEQKYLEDLQSTEPKHIRSKEEMKEILDILYSKLRNFYHLDFPTGRVVELYQDDDPVFESVNKYRRNILNNLQNMLSPESKIFGVLDINGQFYIRTYTETIKTELAFNFKNKDKKTAPIGLDILDMVLTNDVLNNII